jgi:hypothetical protein
MFLLRHNNVDNYPSTWDKFKEKPTQGELKETFLAYYSEGLSERLAEELLEHGEADANNGSCDVFELEDV